MADTKISALSAGSALAGTEAFAAVQSGSTVKALASDIKTYVNNAPVFAAGSASASSWPKLTSGTLLTTAEAGALELDANCLYGTTDASNRGIIPIRNIIRADSTRTFTSNTSQQAIFNSPSNGTLTLETGAYLFEALIQVTSTSGTSGNIKFSLNSGGGASLAAILYIVTGLDAADNTITAISGLSETTSTVSATNTVTASTATTTTFLVKGTFEVSVAGSIIPSMAQTTAAAAVVSIGSYFMCERIGSTSMASVGQWT